MDINTCRLFIHMILKANWKDGSFRGTTVPRGSFVSSISKLAEETNLTNDEVRTAISHLVRTGEITKQSSNKFTLFTVEKYELYQDNPNQTTNQDPSSSQSIPNLFPTIEEGKKERNKEIYRDDKSSLRQTESVRRVIDAWNSLSKYGIKKVSRVNSGSKRYNSLVARLNEYGEEEVLHAIENVKHSDFLQGKESGKSWTITFDWFVVPSNFPKVLEGNYDNRDQVKKIPRVQDNNNFERRRYSEDMLSALQDN